MVIWIIGGIFLLAFIITFIRIVVSPIVICSVCDRKFKFIGTSINCPHCKTKYAKKADGEVFKVTQ